LYLDSEFRSSPLFSHSSKSLVHEKESKYVCNWS
jgi:hypothetical protein